MTLVSLSAFADVTTIVLANAASALRNGSSTARLELVLPLKNGDRTVVLEEFQLWAPDGHVVIHGDGGDELISPPKSRTYRGTVDGDPDSFVFLSVDSGGQMEGMAEAEGDHYNLTSEATPKERPSPPRWHRARRENLLPSRSRWSCAVDAVRPPHAVMSPLNARESKAGDPRPMGITGTQTYAAHLEIETDYELYRLGGSSLNTWVTSLTGALATIYARDLHTTVLIHNIRVYNSAASCPWTSQPSQGVLAAMYQLADYYHQYYPSVPRSAVVLLSGKNFGSGASWEASLCGGDFACASGNCGDASADGHYGGAYAVCGSVTNGTVPDPASSQNGVPNGLPSDNFWPLEEYSHELGHILGGRHTNCIALTAADAAQYGRTYVDYCYSGEYSCYSGDVSAPVEAGTIMSACFNVFSGAFPSSRYIFGKAGEASHAELDDYMYRSGGTVDGGPNIISAAATTTMSAISLPQTVFANSTSNVATVTASAGAVYEWLITNGTITSGAASNQVTFTANASGTVTLRCSVYNSTGCAGVSDAASAPITTAAPSQPGAVIAWAATATSVHVEWTAPPGTSLYYNVYRSSDNISYTLAGCTTSTTLTDTAVAANTAYLYKVRAAFGTPPTPWTPSGESVDSNRDLATTVLFTDASLAIAPGVTIKAQHLTTLRTAVTAVYKLAFGAAAAPAYTDPSVVSCAQNQQCTTVKATHVTDLRTFLNSARQQLNVGQWTFGTDPTLTGCNPASPSTCIAIKAAHFNELRQAVDRENH